MSKLDTHSYDGKIYIPDRKFNLNFTKEQKQKIIMDFLPKLSVDTARQAVNIISNDIDTKNNYSNSDNLYADVILVNILSDKFFNENISTLIKPLEEQLSDIVTSGQCAQGRTNRLMQIYLTLN